MTGFALNVRSAVGDTADLAFLCALAERDWVAAEQALTALGNNPFWGDLVTLKRQFGEGLLAHAMHDEARARKAFAAARLEQEQVVQQQKDYGPAVCLLGLIDATLGNKEAALQEGRRAMELLPVEKDSINWAKRKGLLRFDRGLGRRKGFGVATVGHRSANIRGSHSHELRHA